MSHKNDHYKKSSVPPSSETLPPFPPPWLSPRNILIDVVIININIIHGCHETIVKQLQKPFLDAQASNQQSQPVDSFPINRLLVVVIIVVMIMVIMVIIVVMVMVTMVIIMVQVIMGTFKKSLPENVSRHPV